MQFKEVGNRIQVLAYRGYDKEKKRAIVKMLGSFNKYSLDPDSKLIESMTEEEKEELQSYIKAERQSNKERSDRYTTEHLDSSIKLVSDSLSKECHYMTDEIAARLYDSITELQKSMRKAGFSRKKAEKADPKKCKKTADLLGS